MYKGMKWWQDKKFQKWVYMAIAFVIIIYVLWSIAGQPKFF